ncbi:MAG TPA: hypothetical protein VFB38_15330 [Chthonomonadaceae bacterium]|nr:hypothetical protein [Chthonomonadaceae bacterium]
MQSLTAFPRLSFEWRYNFFNTAFVIKDGSGNDLLSFTSITGAAKNQPYSCGATMEFKVPAEALAEVAFLALAGWYTLLPAIQSFDGDGGVITSH